jgi:protein involved in sex pheromone biosynthesis
MRKILTVVIFTTLITIGGFGAVWAIEYEKTASIINRCNDIKKDIKTLQVADTNTRVALGREYENILTKLMTNMNSRLAQNHQNAGNLLNITADFSAKLTAFREAYQAYDQKIEALLAVNCEKNPNGFYGVLEESRAKRSEVQATYATLISIAEAYETELTMIWETK